jgi:alkylation response protein AidB-like acyl-CoA dehydrogenase
VPIATSDEQRAVAESLRAWAAQAGPVASARAQESAPDAWRKHWPELAALGVLSVPVPEGHGGAGGSPVDVAVLLEAAADALVPGPLLPSLLAAMLLARSPGAAADTLLPSLATGETTAAVALSPGGLTATVSASGDLLVRGTSAPIVGADAPGALLLCASLGGQVVWFAVAPESSACVRDVPPGDFSRSLARVEADGLRIEHGWVLESLTTELVRDVAATLGAAEAAGVAAWCLRTAVDYAKVREQFGRPIGSFQAIKHLCAEMLCRAEVASALAWDAATSLDDAEQRPLAAAVAAAAALDAGVETAKDCIQVLGGIGFTWEHDAHLYLRRAVALRQMLGGTRSWRRRCAELAAHGARRELHLDLGAAAQAHRAEIRETVEQIAALPDEQRRAALADAGYLAPHWPRPHGLAADALEQLVIEQELHHAGLVRPDLVIGGWAAPTILEHGTAVQVERFVGPTLRGEIVWCQLFSEPGAGSDLASLRTRAERVDGGWRLSGQKVWTSVAHRADWGICLARTDPEAEKHRGITYFLVDMRSPGLDVRPLREITGEALFNEVFLDGVFVPDELVVGAVNDGWRLARTTLGNERVAMGRGSSLGESVEQLLAQVQGSGSFSDPAVREDVGGLIADGTACSVLELRAALRRLDGLAVGPESSVRKLVGVRHRQAVAEAALAALGEDGTADSSQFHAFLQTRCLTIAGGTTQVLLTLAAERLLGLPRD